ncbi:hypothetical protein INH39_25605 [Massilia violaceinigra]|uniref:Phage tail protein n=1 Tax=Massilia violaceinigra TaxID=2045208 RepID=A0ABY4A203_9BURK|nr:hypothetical protein [Massilia violaceinigra]UOD28788.1 hypothetical protein INH39_25605 [Massilia violaceinigra]
MPIIKVPAAGALGVVKDVSQHALPPNAWTDANNMRFLDGSVRQFYGHGAVYGTPAVTPLHVVPVNIGAARYWLYAGAQKIYAVTAATGTDVHTNLTRQTASVDVNYAGAPNAWTSTVLSGIPILNAGNLIDPPQRWNLDTAQRCVKLDNWPDNTFCKSLRAYKNFLVALHVTKAGVTFPYMVKWSHPADPGGVPASWDPADATRDAGELDLAEGGDQIIDGLQLRDSFMIYKEQSVWRMDFTGGQYVFRFSKVLGLSGAMNRNCIVEIDGFHFVLTGSDVVIHDGQSPTQVLDKVARRALFQDMDVASADRAFVFKNPFLNEVFVCYPSIGNTIPNKAMVWNYKDRTVSYREIPSLHHANYGPIDSTLSGSWAADPDSWESDLTAWNGPDFTPNVARVLMAAAGPNLFMLDSSASFNGVAPTSYLERRALSFGDDERVKTITGVRARVTGNPGQTITVRIGGHQTDPFADPEWTASMTHVIGQTIACDGFASFRYPAIRFESGTAVQWRLDNYDFSVNDGGKW